MPMGGATHVVLVRPLTHHRVWDGPLNHVDVTVTKEGLLGDAEPYPQNGCVSKNIGHNVWGADANVIACNGGSRKKKNDMWRSPPGGVAACVPPIYTPPQPVGDYR